MKSQARVRPDERRGEVRMVDVARLAGVSTMTVSRALRHPESVSTVARGRIAHAVRDTGYLPNRIAGHLSSMRSNVVGLVVPSLRNSLFAETIQGVADVLGQHYDLMVADSGYTLRGEETAVRAFLGQRVCAVVLHNTTHTPATRRLLRDAGVACVETGNLVRNPIDMAVGFSNLDAGFAMTEHLIRRGYRRVAFVSLPTRDNDRAAARRAGYVKALERFRRRVDEALILETPPGLRSGGAALARLLDGGQRVDAVFLTGDVLATGAVLEANRRGWTIPARVAIAGSDDNELQESVVPSITSIRFPRYDIGRRAGQLLIERVEGGGSRGRGRRSRLRDHAAGQCLIPGPRAVCVSLSYVASGFSRTSRGPPEGGHYVHVETALIPAPDPELPFSKERPCTRNQTTQR